MLVLSPLRTAARCASRFARRPIAFLTDTKAATAVEFAMIGAPFFMIFCAIFESALLVFAQGNLEAATYAVSRQLLTGQVQTQATPWSQTSDVRTALCNTASTGLLGLFCADATKMFIDVRNASDFTTNPAASALFTASNNDYFPGSSGSVIVMRVGFLYPLYFTGWFNSWGGSSNSTTRQMTATVVFKAENY